METCVFCKIIAKKLPSRVLYEDDLALAFEDLDPKAPVHVLVIPKKHIPTALDIEKEDNALVGHLFQVANTVVREKGIDERGFRLVMNAKSDAGQAVFHIHLHVLGGRHMHWPPG